MAAAAPRSGGPGTAGAAATSSCCPCGSGSSPYGSCCARWHAGALALQAPDAASLMRSRYSAFVLGLDAYVLATWHADTRPAALEPAPLGLRWLGLDVRAATAQEDDHATVEFVARSKLNGRAQRLHEVSRFVREDGRWYYLDGELR